MPVAREQQLPVAAGHQVGAEGHLDHQLKPSARNMPTICV